LTDSSWFTCPSLVTYHLPFDGSHSHPPQPRLDFVAQGVKVPVITLAVQDPSDLTVELGEQVRVYAETQNASVVHVSDVLHRALESTLFDDGPLRAVMQYYCYVAAVVDPVAAETLRYRRSLKCIANADIGGAAARRLSEIAREALEWEPLPTLAPLVYADDVTTETDVARDTSESPMRL
jgi:hypothetical protein